MSGDPAVTPLHPVEPGILGPIVRLQIQRDPVKVGKAPLREYRPEVIIPVRSFEVSERGVVGQVDGRQVVDAHHRDHPASRDPRGRAGLTVMATGDYQNLRATYGDHLADGIAGESILIDHPGLAGSDFPAGLTVLTRTGPLTLSGLRVADPCVEFTRFCLRLPTSAEVGTNVRDGLADLGGGRRGYRAVAAGVATVHLGDTLVAN